MLEWGVAIKFATPHSCFINKNDRCKLPFKAGTVSDGINKKHLPRNDTEFHGRKTKQKHLPRINTEKTQAETRKTEAEAEAEALATETKHCFQLNKRGQVSFSAHTIIYSWFRLAAEKET